MTETIHALLVEDDELDAETVERMLLPSESTAAAEVSVEVSRAETLADARENLAHSHTDVVLLDLGLPDSAGLSSVGSLLRDFPEVPVVVLTGADDQKTGMEAVGHGAQDYLVKDQISAPELLRCLLYAIERNKLQRELAHRLAELETANRSLGLTIEDLRQFSWASAHDLQTPIYNFSRVAQTLAAKYKDRLDEAGRELVDNAVQQTKFLKQQLDDMLRYLNLTGRQPKIESVDLGDLLVRLEQRLATPLESAGATIQNQQLPTIPADASLLSQLLGELLKNAIIYRAEAPLEIHVEAWETTGEWIFSVRDNGIGIEPEQTGRIFGLMTRLHPPGKYPGTGIGLAICKKIVEQHHGRIWVESELGRGAIFYVALPQR